MDLEYTGRDFHNVDLNNPEDIDSNLLHFELRIAHRFGMG